MSQAGICILPRLEGLGGPASFRYRLSTALAARGIPVYDRPDEGPCQAVLVIAGTRRLDQLLWARRRGIRVVQRLDGLNWVHRKRRLGLRFTLRAEYGNRLLALIRARLAQRVVYQSQFARTWWQTLYGPLRTPMQVIYNGVDLNIYHPDGPNERPEDFFRLLLVEGNLGGGNEQGLFNALRLAQALDGRLERPVELKVAGNVPDSMRAEIEDQAGGLRLSWAGVVPRAEIPQLDRSAHLLFSADLNAACPNAVIEALACGLPAVGFATGSLPELIDEDAGRVVPYGANYWNLEPPQIAPLAEAAAEVLADPQRYRLAARQRAVELFDLEKVVQSYLDVLLG